MNSLRTYLALKNSRKVTFARKGERIQLLPNDPTRLTLEQRKQVKETLLCDISPENLYWDGERDRSEALTEYEFLKSVAADLVALGEQVEFW